MPKYISTVQTQDGVDDWQYPRDHLIFYYVPDTNIFINCDGDLVDNIYEYITPNDMHIFRRDPGHCVFNKRDDYDVLIELQMDDDNPLHNTSCLYELSSCQYAPWCLEDGMCRKARLMEKDNFEPPNGGSLVTIVDRQRVHMRDFDFNRP